MRLIDADAFIEKARSRIDMQDMYLPIHIKEMVLDEMPTVDAMPVRHGKWIKMDKDNTFFAPHMLKCSLCGNVLDRHGVNAGRGDANYCPNCGARMEEE